MSNGTSDLSGMTPREVIEDLKQRIVPRMQEAGIEAFALVGYAKFDGEHLTRFVIVNDGDNPAYQDGLRPVVQFARFWGMEAAEFPPQPPPAGSPPT